MTAVTASGAPAGSSVGVFKGNPTQMPISLSTPWMQLRRAFHALERSETLQERAIVTLFAAALIDMGYLVYFLIV